MIATSTVVGTSMLPHGLHTALVLLGLWGLAALLLPHALTQRAQRGGVTELIGQVALDEHASRVAELRQAITSGALSTSPVVDLSITRAEQVAAGTRPEPALGPPLAMVSGATAAGIHAAVVPAHLGEEPLFASFFLLVAGAQVAWAASVATRPTPRVLVAGVVLHLALVGLWLFTRVASLPFGLMAEPHAVGGWDLAAVAWQLTSVAACVRVLHDGAPRQVPGWFAWHPTTRAAVGLAAVLVVLLTQVGAHS